MTRLAGNYPSRSRNGKIELKILNQPEEQHRARYLTEGSRGSIKDGTGLGHPVVKLFGFNGCPVKLQCFIGHDKYIGVPHLFYQASRITGKNSTRCSTTKIEGTAVITLDLSPENNMQTAIDCIGILKERNVDVEQKVLRLKSLNGGYNNGDNLTFPSKKRCAKCRLVFRCKIPGTNEILQAVSTPILCTQPVGTPEICKMSMTECKITGGKELYLIGKNFLKDSKVIFKTEDWCKVIEPDKEYLHSSHMICSVPPYDGPNSEYPGYFTVSINVRSGGKYSDSHTFTYINDSKANSVSIQRPLPSNHHHQQIHHQLSHHSPPYHHEMINKQAHFFPILAQSQMANQLAANIKRESSPLCHMDMESPKSLLNTPMAMDTTSGRQYFSEDTLLSSDSSTISETILASEDSCFSNHSNLTSPHSSNTVDMSDFIGRLNESTQMVNNNSTSSPDVLQQQHHQQQQQQQQRTFENIHVQQAIGNGFTTSTGNEAVGSNTNSVHMVNLHSSLVSVTPTTDTGHYLQSNDSECMMKQLNQLAAGGSPPKADNQFFTMSMVNGSNGMTAVSVIAAHQQQQQQQQQSVQATTNNCQNSTIQTNSSMTNAQASPPPGSVSNSSSQQLIVDNASLTPSQLMPPPPIPCQSMMVVKDEPSSSMGVSPSPPTSMDVVTPSVVATPHTMLPDNDIHNATGVVTTGGMGITSSTVATVNNGTLSHDNSSNTPTSSNTNANISNMSISNTSSHIVTNNQTSTPSIMDTASLPSSLTMNSCTVPVTASTPPTTGPTGTINPMQIVANGNTNGVPVVTTSNTSTATPNGGVPTVIQASQISAMSQMSDTELIRLINPSTFDEFREDVSMFNNFPFSSSNIYRK